MDAFNCKLTVEELKNELQIELAETIGIESYLLLSQRYGGTSIYVAKAGEIEHRKNRDEKLRKEFNGNNYNQLALKYQLSEVWVRKIVFEKAKEIKQKPVEGQMNLMEFI